MKISKYKKYFSKFCTANWSQEVFVINKAKNGVLWTYVMIDTNGEEIIGTFYERVAKDKPNLVEDQNSNPKKRRQPVYQMEGL